MEYYRGYAWLKIPLGHGKRLLGTPFHDRVTVRWQPGSWRMHVPLVHGEKNGIDLAYAAQIYFPAEQIRELTTILTDLSTDKRRTTGR